MPTTLCGRRHNNAAQKEALVNSTRDTLKKRQLRGQTEPGLVTLYYKCPENRVGVFLQPGACTGLLNKPEVDQSVHSLSLHTPCT